MFDAPNTGDEASSSTSAGQASNYQAEPVKRKHRSRRVVLITLGSLLALVIVAALGIYAYVNHTVSSIPRLHVAHLVPGTSSLDGQTFLITTDPQGPTGSSIQAPPQPSEANLVMLLHINANGKGGGAVTIPGYVWVHVPGAGTEQLWDALQDGGPSLAVQTVAQVTGIPINHYARGDFSHIAGLVDTIGGVDVTIPNATQAFGYKFVNGVNHLTGVTAVYYGRDPAISSQARLLRQENLTRTVIAKIADDRLLIDPLTAVHVLNAITGMLAVDSNMTNSEIVSFARQFSKLTSAAATFVTAPTVTVNGKVVLNTALDDQLWTAVKHNSIAAFAEKYPSTLAPTITP
jgi:LCP family protein required for cell wall assembly